MPGQRARARQVRAIYIRDVTQTPERDFSKSLGGLAKHGAIARHRVLVENTHQAAEHAARNGYISPALLPSIRADNDRDAAPPGPVERVVGEGD